MHLNKDLNIKNWENYDYNTEYTTDCIFFLKKTLYGKKLYNL